MSLQLVPNYRAQIIYLSFKLKKQTGKSNIKKKSTVPTSGEKNPLGSQNINPSKSNITFKYVKDTETHNLIL